ncbi:MAG: hypothetical protein IPP14_09085 [Planctomycetes bacterium]|nr:hypothetical protein [Planctomycetota bacterium]
MDDTTSTTIVVTDAGSTSAPVYAALNGQTQGFVLVYTWEVTTMIETKSTLALQERQRRYCSRIATSLVCTVLLLASISCGKDPESRHRDNAKGEASTQIVALNAILITAWRKGDRIGDVDELGKRGERYSRYTVASLNGRYLSQSDYSWLMEERSDGTVVVRYRLTPSNEDLGTLVITVSESPTGHREMEGLEWVE